MVKIVLVSKMCSQQSPQQLRYGQLAWRASNYTIGPLLHSIVSTSCPESPDPSSPQSLRKGLRTRLREFRAISHTGCLYLETSNMTAIFTHFKLYIFFLCTFGRSLNSWIVKYVHLGTWKCNQKAVIVFEEEMGHLSRWHTSKLSMKKWHYTELPWKQLKGRERCRTSYSFIISWAVWRNASCFREYKEKSLLAHQVGHNLTLQTLYSPWQMAFLQIAHRNMKVQC